MCNLHFLIRYILQGQCFYARNLFIFQGLLYHLISRDKHCRTAAQEGKGVTVYHACPFQQLRESEIRRSTAALCQVCLQTSVAQCILFVFEQSVLSVAFIRIGFSVTPSLSFICDFLKGNKHRFSVGCIHIQYLIEIVAARYLPILNEPEVESRFHRNNLCTACRIQTDRFAQHRMGVDNTFSHAGRNRCQFSFIIQHHQRVTAFLFYKLISVYTGLKHFVRRNK